jgi:hypothetical protein
MDTQKEYEIMKFASHEEDMRWRVQRAQAEFFKAKEEYLTVLRESQKVFEQAAIDMGKIAKGERP